MEIKVGDKVKVKNMFYDVLDKIKIGDIGIVDEIISTEYPIWVQFGECGSSYGFKENELELIVT